ncbi:unnamed protein product (mitochondrion) [Plasmodiophora brassicae]|uniref:Store-operated calcium entry-associated regulatory factor n=2 Tax=Plasmodiophora brassicae TaxID=37360 RepID=A0A3P3YMF0_PLABS|nr:unnamed protein product [Plasmodiophora brassicae]
MMTCRWQVVAALSVAAVVAAVVVVAGAADKVRLRDVSVLTFHTSKMTKGRRASPIPQLTCRGSCKYRPDTVQCRNVGWDGSDVQWECYADMPSSYRFGVVEVSCEGYSYPDDSFVLAGSCGLTYEVVSAGDSTRRPDRYGRDTSKDAWAATLIQWAVFALVAYFIWTSCCSGRGRERHSGDGGGWGGGHPPHDPPPYSAFERPAPSCDTPPSYSTSSSSRSSGPGFFSGMGLGGVLGYMFGNRNRARTYASSHYDSPGWFGGWGSRPSHSGFSHAATSNSSDGGGSGNSSSSSTTHRRATGYATTTRR